MRSVQHLDVVIALHAGDEELRDRINTLLATPDVERDISGFLD